ncbi:Uncharacterised protein [Alistipes sp. cv1]|uniref:hypothetical protein n=1 Tax=Alistipes indistinctus TaxID=626932 RepID=UPI0006BEF9C7|nr:Uncharacterised protein [Faecalibacterium prausnitzii]
MNYTSMQMQDTLRRLEATLPETTPEQRRLLDDLNAQIEENGRYYVVESLTVEQMREHGYDVTEKDGGLIDKIAEKVEVDADMLWSAVEIWAKTYNVKQIENF